MAAVDALSTADKTIVTSSTYAPVEDSETTVAAAYTAAVDALKDRLPEPDANGVVTLTESLTLEETPDLTEISEINLNNFDITFTKDFTGKPTESSSDCSMDALVVQGGETLKITGEGTIALAEDCTVAGANVIGVVGDGVLEIGPNITLHTAATVVNGAASAAISVHSAANGATITVDGRLEGMVGMTVHNSGSQNCTINVNGTVDVTN